MTRVLWTERRGLFRTVAWDGRIGPDRVAVIRPAPKKRGFVVSGCAGPGRIGFPLLRARTLEDAKSVVDRKLSRLATI